MTRACLLLLLLACSVLPLTAQGTTARLAGSITDASGTPLPGASITVTHTGNGSARHLTSDADGRYRALNLGPGVYRVEIALEGFVTAVRPAVTLAMGADVRADVRLELGARDRIVVQGDAAAVDIGSAAIGGVVSTRQIAELPLNGRSFLQLATLQPGVAVSRGTPREFSGGFGATQVSVAGARPEHTAFILDGTNIADISDKAPSSLAGVLLGVDTVSEFTVRTHGYTAEFGRGAGGIISAVTKAGTNQLRGSVFEFHRNSHLDARSAFDVADPPSFVRNQFGGTAGGPVVRNRVFFFGSYEGLRDGRATTRHARLPNARAHDGLLPDAGGGGLRDVGVHPGVRPYLDLLFPIPSGRDFGDGTAEMAHAHHDRITEHFVVGRGDWHPGGDDSVLLRFSRDWSDSIAGQEHPLFRETASTAMRFLTLQHQRIIGSRFVNSVRAAANRTARANDVVPIVTIPASLYFTEDPHWGAINIAGVSLAGSTSTIPVKYTQDVYQLADTLTWASGAHIIKAGFDWQRYRFDGYSYSRYGGEFRFRNLQEFLTLRRSATAQADRFTGNLPGTDTERQMRQHHVAAFVQDEWRASDRVSLSVGLRYERVTVPRELDGKLGALLRLDDLNTRELGTTPDAPLFRNPSGRVAPRAGLAWQPVKNDPTTIRAGWGIFEQPLTVSFYRGTVFRMYPYFAGVDIRQPAVFGAGNKDVLAGGIDPSVVQRRSEFIMHDLAQPHFHQWHVQAQRTIGPAAIEAGYLGSRGVHLPFYGDPNAVPSEYLPDGTKRIVPGAAIRYPTWGRVRVRTNTARSSYHGLVLGASTRGAGSLMLQASYTLGSSRDTWSGGLVGNADFENGAGGATDWFDPEYELGPSNFDVRHTLVVNGIYQVPEGRLRGLGRMVAGWQVAALLQMSSGVPFTPYIGFDHAGDQQSDTLQQRPDLVAAVRYPRTAEQWFDPSAFVLPAAGTFGTSRRNSLRAPGVKTVDVSLSRAVRAGRVGAQLRVEAFNVFNWVNLGLPAASILFNPDGSRFSGAGRITTTSTPGRQIQLGLRVTF